VDPETTLRFWLVAIELLALLALLGYPIARLAARWSGGALVLPAPLLGLPVAYLLSWWWVRATGLGLDAGVPVMAGVAALAWLPILYGLGRRPPAIRDLGRRAIVPLVTFLAVAVLFTVHFSSVFRLDHLSSAAGSNIDVAAYSLVAGHLVEEGLSGPGNIYAYDLSERAEGDAFGATALVAAAAAASGHEAWEVGAAVLFVAILVLALSLVALIRRLWPQAGVVAALAALVGVANFLFIYLTLQFFLAQILAAGLLCGVLVALLAAIDAPDRRALGASAVVIALVGAAMVATYPHMALLGPAVLLPAVAVCVPRASWRAGVLRLGMAGGAGAVLAIVLAPDQFLTAVERARLLSGVIAGWPMAGFLPSDLVGAMRADVPPGGAARWLGSAVVLGAIVASAALLWRAGRLARFTALAWAGGLASYAAIYLREGDESYRQWKWITFFLPVMVALAAALVIAAALALTRRARVAPQRARPAALAALAVVVALQTAAAESFVSRYLGGPAPGVHVSADLAGVAEDARVRDLAGVSLNFNEPTEVQWAAAVLRPREIYAFPAPAGVARPWVLERAGARAPGPELEVVPINATYQLSYDSPPAATATAAEVAP
jgi:hypothetical protein